MKTKFTHKNLTTLLTLLLSLFLITTSCDNGGYIDASTIDQCGEQHSKIVLMLEKCEINVSNNSLYKEYASFGDICKVYQTVSSDKNDLCRSNIEALTCNDVSALNTVDKLNSIDGCFDFPKKTKKEVCVENYKSYCKSSFYECGESALRGICDDAKNIYGSSESREISFDETKLESYCKTRSDASTEIEKSDLFNQTCSRYRENLDCATVPEFDFRNDNWKTQCTQD